jgi:hypothetical protein
VLDVTDQPGVAERHHPRRGRRKLNSRGDSDKLDESDPDPHYDTANESDADTDARDRTIYGRGVRTGHRGCRQG